jgi:BNR repeat-containing family member
MAAPALRFAAVLLLLSAVSAQAQERGAVAVADVRLLSTKGSTRSTRYAVTNKVVTCDGKTHFAWLDSISKTMVATYDHAADAWLPATKVGDGHDNHGGPALTCDSAGFLHVIFGPHVGPFQHCRSARPNDASEWVRLSDFGVNATYPSAVCDDQDTLHIIYRGADEPRKLTYQRLPKGGDWSTTRILAHPNMPSGYTHYHASLTIARDQGLHIAYDIFHSGSAKCAGHMMSHDRGDTWTLADGTVLDEPVTPEQDTFFKRDEDGLCTGGIVCDSKGNPWVSVLGPEIWHHDGTDWRSIPVRQRLPQGVDGAKLTGVGPLTLDADDCVYLVALLGRDVVLVHSDDRGETFRLLHIFPPDAKLPHTGLTIERPTGHNTVNLPWLLFATGEKGPDCFGEGIYHQVRAVRLTR